MSKSSNTDIADLMVHDVAKYIVRAAKNWDEKLFEALHPMLISDIFGGTPPPCQRLKQLVSELPPALQKDTQLSDAMERLDHLDSIRERIENRDPQACASAVTCALEVAEHLRLFKANLED